VAIPADMIADKLDALLSQGFNPGEPVGDVTDTFDGGVTQPFEFAQIWPHPRVGAFECHGLILDTYRAMGAEMCRLGYPMSDEFDDPNVFGGRMNSFEFGRLRWELTTGVSTEFDEIFQVPPWLVVKLRDEVAPILGTGEALSLLELVQLLEPFAPSGARPVAGDRTRPAVHAGVGTGDSAGVAVAGGPGRRPGAGRRAHESGGVPARRRPRFLRPPVHCRHLDRHPGPGGPGLRDV